MSFKRIHVSAHSISDMPRPVLGIRHPLKAELTHFSLLIATPLRLPRDFETT